MRKMILEILAGLVFVLGGTYIVYGALAGFPTFWQTQSVWSLILVVLWAVVAGGYFHQGWLVHRGKNSDNVSLLLPAVVFFVQCVLFVKGVFYGDWSLIVGALMVNSSVTFSLYHILKNKRLRRAYFN